MLRPIFSSVPDGLCLAKLDSKVRLACLPHLNLLWKNLSCRPTFDPAHKHFTPFLKALFPLFDNCFAVPHTTVNAKRHICSLACICPGTLCCLVTQSICRSSLLHVSDVAVAYHAANPGANICQYGGHSCAACHGRHSRHIPAASVRHARGQPIAHVHVQ